MNPFAKYRTINAEEIIKANIRPNNIGEDSNSLLNALQPITYIAVATLESQRATSLHRNVIQKLTPKPHTLKLLEDLGYELSIKGDYVYQSTSSDKEMAKRENVIKEFQLFYVDLKKIKSGTLDGFEEYIESVPSEPSTPMDDGSDDSFYFPQESPERASLSSRASFRPPSPVQMPDYQTVERNNERTIEAIRSLKEMIKPKHDGHVSHSFIRRQLLFRLFQQKYPDAMEVGDQEADVDIDRRIGDLRLRDRTPEVKDEIYFECLLRTHFEPDNALQMLRYNRPNLQPPPEPETPRGPSTTTLDASLPSIQQQREALTRYANENGGEQILIQAGDEWKNTVHVVAGIIQLRKEFNSQSENNHLVNKMFRLIFTELSKVIGQQSELKIEMLANGLCEASPESIEHLSMGDIRDIVHSCDDRAISHHFQDNVIKFLSAECPICYGSYPRSYMETMFLCSHTCCLDCVKNYYRDAIKEIRDPESLKKLTCFQEAHEISEDTKLNFFNYLGPKLNQWFPDEKRLLELYNENLYHATRDSRDRKCGNTKCPGFFYNDNNRVARAQCPHCHFYQCQQCCRKWHDEHKTRNCDEYAEWLKENDPDDPEVQLLKYLNTAGMICPNPECGAVFEYQAGGCEHFTCRRCKTEFCRICSALFYNPVHNTICPRATCTQKKALHAHCCLNCFREIRDAEPEEIIRLLTTHKINYQEEFRQKPVANGLKCPVDGCTRAPSVTCENRFCEMCYRQFLCLFVWRNQIEPWELYTENNLRQKLISASVNVPANTAKPALITLARQHLTQFLGKPQKIDRRNLQ